MGGTAIEPWPMERRKWADSAPTWIDLGRTGVRAKAAFHCEPEIGSLPAGDFAKVEAALPPAGPWKPLDFQGTMDQSKDWKIACN
jgi:hypothetical protein